MIGELLGEEKGKVTTYRVVKSEGAHKVEVTFRTEGTVAGRSDARHRHLLIAGAPGRFSVWRRARGHHDQGRR